LQPTCAQLHRHINFMVIYGEKQWLCAEHYDEHARLMAQMGRTPENEELQ